MMSDSSNDNCLDYTVYVLAKQAMALEEGYTEMLHQGDEVDLRIRLWRDAVGICKNDYKRMSYPRT
jgi:hypothetical protein